MSKFADMARDAGIEIARRKPKDPRPWKEIRFPHQVPPDTDWRTWMILGGRGSGKSRCGAEMCHEWANLLPGSRGILVGKTADDVRNTMIEGESGLVTMYPEIKYQPAIRRLVWPNGTIAQCYYAESPDTLRGPQCHWFWADEVGTWSDAQKGDIEDTTWNNLMMGCRLTGYEGWEPKGIATLTPKPVKLVIDLVNDPSVVLTKASTFDNQSLSKKALEFYTRKYEGTRAGRQELYAELLMDAVGALWNSHLLDSGRVQECPVLVKVAVGWDPATTSGERSDEHGIVVVGVDENSHGYVLEDVSKIMTPDKAAMEVARMVKKWGANMVVYEKNQGGDFVPTVLRNVATGVPCIGVHAKNGKRLRAEPVQALYEQGRIHHVGYFPQLETSMTTWDPDDPKSKSPDRIDAMVYAFTWAFEGGGGLARQSFRIGFRRR